MQGGLCRQSEFVHLFPVYMSKPVPIYLHPSPSMLRSLVESLKRVHGSYREARRVMRRALRCFISENTIWKCRVHGVRVDGYSEPPAPPVLTHAVVMVRGATDLVSLLGEIRSLGVRVNPYAVPAPGPGDYSCAGFYAGSFEEIERVVSTLGERGVICDAMIVNAVWYMRLGSLVDLRALTSTRYFVPTLRFNAVVGTIEESKVIVFSTGTVRINRALSPQDARAVAGKLYYLLRESGALLD